MKPESADPEWLGVCISKVAIPQGLLGDSREEVTGRRAGPQDKAWGVSSFTCRQQSWEEPGRPDAPLKSQVGRPLGEVYMPPSQVTSRTAESLGDAPCWHQPLCSEEAAAEECENMTDVTQI